MAPKKKLTLGERMYQDRWDETLDWNRAETADPRDPRGATCEHKVEKPNCRIANAHMVQYKCQECAMILLYVPKKGSMGRFRKATELQAATGPAGPHNKHDRKLKVPEIPESEPTPTQPTSKAKAKAECRSVGVCTSPPPEEEEEEEEEVAEEEQATPPPPPQWDGDAGTAKAYKRMLKKWMDKYGDLDQEETEEEETSSVQAESVTESPNTSQAWELLNEMLKELRSVGVPESASASASMPSTQGTGSHPARGSRR